MEPLMHVSKDELRLRKIREQLERIPRKIAVYSAKGGVGKTTVAVNLAASLSLAGHVTGLLDADIDCPNAGQFLGVHAKSGARAGTLAPVEAHGVQFMSIAQVMEDAKRELVWRGPMLHHALLDLLEKTGWTGIEYLVIDLPPGTSDVPLTLLQMVPVDGYVIVTTSQEAALGDARKAVRAVQRFNGTVLGIVENFSSAALGKGGGKRLAAELGVPFLGSIPLSKAIRESGDAGRPAVLEDGRMNKLFLRFVQMTGILGEQE